jgi:two-component system sensor histidine kinase KdpD
VGRSTAGSCVFTWAMRRVSARPVRCCEGLRHAERGTDVVVASVATYGRAHTARLLAGLEVIPPARVPCAGATAVEMDLDAMLARAPRVALVDELAHSNVPSARNAKRWEDVEDLLAAGIDVISTVSIEHLDSLADVVEKITGLAPRQTVPDPVVRAAGEVDLVDLAPEALRDRMVRGNIYPPSEAQAALARWFRICNLTAMRELALLWLATMLASGPRRHWPGGCDPGSGHARGGWLDSAAVPKASR